MVRPSAAAIWAVVVGALLALVYACTLAWALENHSYNVWGSLIVVPLVVAVNAVLIWRVTLREAEPWLPRLLGVAFAAKMIGVLARYLVAYVVYRGGADAERYNRYASYQYELWRQGFVVWEWGGKQGTQFMELITTAIYTVIGPAPLAGFFVYGSFAFWGAYLLYRAFRIAVPDGGGRRYALLVFFLPSMLYWPSSIGKESWLLLFVGVTALGAAKLFARERGALLVLAAGGVGTAIIRPHVSVLLFAALLVAQLFRPTSGQAMSVLSKAVGIFIMAGAAVVLTTQTAEFLGIDDLSVQGVTEKIEWASGQTVQGGSEFDPVSLSSPLGIPAAIVTLLFRPFPWEANNAQMLLQSLEGLFLIVLTVRSWPRLRRLPGILRRNPYVVFAVVYVLAYIVAFSGFGNFGILARQRALMLPLFLVLLALPAAEYSPRRGALLRV